MGTQVSKDLSSTSNITIISIIGIIIAGLIISIVLSVFIANGISRPIVNVQRAAEQLEAGDLNIQLSTSLQDEIGAMSSSFSAAAKQLRAYINDIGNSLGEMAKGNFCVKATEDYRGDFKKIEESIEEISSSLSQTLSQINQASEQVSAGADQVSSGAQALSQGATEQASSVEELSASITEISSQVKRNAENAAGASLKVSEVSGQLVQSNHQMQALTDAMNEISNSSQEIGKIIKTIEDIAFQTNILALNAAVEAARAGAAGKGFAVVADEVRNLASKSAEAAKNTTVLIEGSIKAVENGTRIADETAKSLLSVVEGAREVSDGVNEISHASGEQAEAIAQVTVGVDQISSVVQTNSATAEESAAASEELSGQAQMLKNLVGRFTLKQDEEGALGEPSPLQESLLSQSFVSPRHYASVGGSKY